jgi:acyl-coenzyme A thioesterase 13
MVETSQSPKASSSLSDTTPAHPRVPSDIPGTATYEQKSDVLQVLDLFNHYEGIFGESVGKKIRITDVSVEPFGRGRKATVVCELTVVRDMLNGGLILHGGCSAYLIDVCSSLPLVAASDGKHWVTGGLSQSLNINYHSPAFEGTRLRIVSTSLNIGKRSATSRCEVWDKDKGVLVSSGTHLKAAINGGFKKPSPKL